MKRGSMRAFGLLLVFVTLGLAGMAPVYAAATGPGNATAPPNDWQQLEAGGSHWYGFQYAGDNSQIEVRLKAVPEGGAAFEVWTPARIERWGLGYEVEPIGRGSDDPFSGGDLIWTGSFSTRGTYYVVVTHTGDQPATSYYLLTVSGPGVSASEPTPAATPQPARSGAKKTATPDVTGTLVFQTSYGSTFYTIDVDGTDLKPVTTGIDPVWAPAPLEGGTGGNLIAFVRWEELRGVWVVDIETGDEWRAFDWSETRYPSFSPDSSQIVFSRQHGGPEERQVCRRGRCFTRPGNEHWRLGIVDAGGGNFYEPNTEKKDSRTPDWAPASADGDLLVYHGEHGLVLESIDGGVAYQLTSTAKDTSPVWSPAPLEGGTGGEQVAFVRRQHDHWEVYVVDAATCAQTQLTKTPARPDGAAASSVSPAWSPDAGHIAFLTDRTGEWEIWVMEAGGSSQRPLFDSELDGLVLDYAFAGERAISWTQ